MRKSPSTSETAFDCPFCGAFTTQYWFKAFAYQFGSDHRLPTLPDKAVIESICADETLSDEKIQEVRDWAKKMDQGLVFFEQNNSGSGLTQEANNLFLSKCFNCRKIAIWVHTKLVFPEQRAGQEPNADLPPDILRDYEEARTILNQSPRGAAALLRLSIQKLCSFLGEAGKSIDNDIGNLVAKGLNPLVQKSLDVVRVIGNEAVHPGTMDLRDDRDTALQLLKIVNVIAEQMISHPNSIQEMYDQLPEEKKRAIEVRNEKVKGDKG